MRYYQVDLGEWLVSAVDVPLGWLLDMPRDPGLLLFALGTALLMTLGRRVFTNQDLLRRCAADQQRLKSLRREASAAGDRPWLERLRRTGSQIKGLQLVADLRTLAGVLLPVGFLALWASQRLDYLPPRVGEELAVRASFSPSSVDRITYLVPTPGLELKSTAVQIVRSTAQSPAMGVSEWTVIPRSTGELEIVIRHSGESAVHRLAVGGRVYHAPLQAHPGPRLTRTEIELPRYLPLGSHCGSEWLGLPPWMIGYIALTLVLVPLWKRLLRVA